MKNRGTVITFAVIIAALCIFYLSFTFVGMKTERAAIALATDASGNVDSKIKQAYKDSLWEKDVFIGYTFRDVKEKILNLGLDLQGGMSLTLEVSPVEIIKALSNNNATKDPNFKNALSSAIELQKNSQTRLTQIFFDEYKRLAGVDKLASIFASSSNSNRITFQSVDIEVEKYVLAEVNSSVDRAFEVIRNRVDKFGVSQPNVQLIQGTGRIQVELPGIDNPERVRKLLQGVAKLEFWGVYEMQEIQESLAAANKILVDRTALENKKSTQVTDTETATDNTSTEGEDDLFVADADSIKVEGDSTSTAADLNSQASELLTLWYQAAGQLAYGLSDTAKINKIIQDPTIKATFPRGTKFLWAVKPMNDREGKTILNEKGSAVLVLYVIKGTSGNKALLGGDVIVDARQGVDERGNFDVSMTMNVTGGKKWFKITEDNVNKRVGIILDDYVYSAPNINEPINGGRSSISGSFTIEEAKDLANVLKAGKLPAPTRIVEEAVVGPSLGVVAQNQGLMSIVVGLVMVVLFMIFYYAKGGLVANIALVVNIFYIFGILANLKAALTLPGIAGIVLTIGMSIDANVLIFERVREELRKGHGLMFAIKEGYDKAFITIVDANVTTFLTALFLYVYGAGPIKGFAITLMVGIACSFFTAVWVTRVIVSYMTSKGDESKMSFAIPATAQLFTNLNIGFLGGRKKAYMASIATILLGAVLLVPSFFGADFGGLNLGVDFQGGRSYVIEFQEDVVPSEAKSILAAAIPNQGFEVKSYDTNDKIKVTTTYLVDDESSEADTKVRASIMEALNGKYSASKPEIRSSSKVGATIADDIKDSSQKAGIFSLIALFIYILIRFKGWQFGLGAVVALFHDSIIVITMFAVANLLGFSFEIDQVFVAAILTIIGYSINDTVVVFDRIRERLHLNPEGELNKVFNEAINSTLSRTLITSFTTLLVVLILFIFGGEVLRGFSFALLIGILVGTYSSIFIATPIVLDFSKKKLSADLAKEVEARKLAEAEAKLDEEKNK
jgi:SecD/SecF fusion protein